MQPAEIMHYSLMVKWAGKPVGRHGAVCNTQLSPIYTLLCILHKWISTKLHWYLLGWRYHGQPIHYYPCRYHPRGCSWEHRMNDPLLWVWACTTSWELLPSRWSHYTFWEPRLIFFTRRKDTGLTLYWWFVSTCSCKYNIISPLKKSFTLY